MVRPFDVAKAIRDIESNSVHLGLQLRDDILQLLRKEAAAATQVEASAPWRRVDEDLRRANTTLAAPVLIVNCESSSLQRAALGVAQDAQLVAVVTHLLGRAPRGFHLRIQDSLVAKADIAFRESRSQTVMFHYDVHALVFAYVFFYLSDVDRDSGAHEVIRGSHRGKRLRHLLGTSRHGDEDVYAVYGRDRALLIEGAAGTGFIEDSSCFHRALPPLCNHRLVLQIRYS